MITQNKRALGKYLMLLVATIALLSCKVNDDKFFELPDTGGIDAAIWNSEGSVQLHLNRVYDVVIPAFPLQLAPDRYGVHAASDENYFPSADANARAALGMQGSLGNDDVRYTGNTYNGNAGSNKYWDIARCNDAITNIPLGTMPQATQRTLLGQYYALRAMVYFEMVKVYGGVPLILVPQTPESIYTDGRKSARECINSIISDLDNAIAMLDGFTPTDDSGRGKMTKLIATCLKAKVLFYYASPQFNPRNDPRHPYDPERWNTALAANKLAYDMCIAAGKRLMTNYADIFRTEGTANTEAILVRTYSNSISSRGHDGEYRVRPASEGGSANPYYLATTKLLNAYTTRDGNKITNATAQYPYDAVMFWQNRDPRFEATIAYNGSSWPLSGNTTRKQWTYNAALAETTGNGVYCKRFSTPGLASGNVRYSNNLGGSGMDWIELRLAEIMLNYADCENEAPLGNISIAKDMVRQIRVRAGIVQGVGTNDYGLGVAGDVATMRDLILNERMVEFAFEGKRNSDLRRSRLMYTLNEPMTKLEIRLVRPFVSTSNQGDKAVLEAVTNGVMFRETLNINDKTTYQRYFINFEYTDPNYLPYNVPTFHNFYTFHNDFVNNGINIAPTIGWAGGTFDPLD